LFWMHDESKNMLIKVKSVILIMMPYYSLK
jgi:hypothetical protein